MAELTSEQRTTFTTANKKRKGGFIRAENLGQSSEVITELTSKVTTLETAYDTQFGE